MAKNYKDNFKDVDGVWRTVGGRRIFIKDGQDLASAMIESGKFKNLKRADVVKAKLDLDEKRLHKEGRELLDNYGKNKYKLGEDYWADKVNKAWAMEQETKKDLLNYDNPLEYKGDVSDLEGKHMPKEKINPMEEYSDTNGKGMTDAQEKILNAVKTSFLYKDEGEMSSGLQKNYELYGKENVDSALKYYEDNYELIKGVASDSEGLTYNDLIKKDEYPENALKYYKNQMEELKNSGLQYEDSKAYNDKADALKEELEKSKDEAKQKYEDIFTPKPEDWEDINHWYNDNPEEEWDKADKEFNEQRKKMEKAYDEYGTNTIEDEVKLNELSRKRDEASFHRAEDDYMKKVFGENSKEYKEYKEQHEKALGKGYINKEDVNAPANTNNQELYNKYMKDANNYDKMKADYDKQEEAYRKEHNKLSDEWHKHKYGTPEYENAYKKLTEHSNQHYKETKDISDKLYKQKEIKALEEQGEKVVFDSKGNLLFHPSSYDKNATRKIDFGIDVNSPTAIKDKEILDSVTGQLSDGIWENSPGQNKYWSNMNYEQHNNKITFATNERGEYNEYSHRWTINPFATKTDQEVKDYVANKIKQIAKIEMKDDPSAGTWDRNNTAVLNYLSREDNITVADAYNLYDRLKGRTPKTSSSMNDDIRRKAYQKYLKEHPGSKMTFNDFMK